VKFNFDISKDIVLRATYETLVLHAEYEMFGADEVHKRVQGHFSLGYVKRLLASLSDEKLVRAEQFDETSAPDFTVTDDGIRRAEELASLNVLLSDEPELERTIPASDRVVSLSHNQINETDAKVSELIEQLEEDNGVPENPGLRERLIGQLKAGRELVRAGEFRAYLLYEVLVKALNEIIEKYGNEAIKALANALLGAVVSRILES
jgi:hypothetical protein